jgi:ribosomal protein S18 acetylase RimI-like enzyme
MNLTTAMAHDKGIQASLLSPEQVKLASSLLYVAYKDDPVFMNIFESEKQDYDKRLRAAIREELNTFWSSRQPMIGLFSGEHLMGVACLIEPQAGINPDRFWHWRLKMMLNAGFLSTKNMIEKEKRVAEAIPNQHYHLLTFIAIHPDHQSHGLGSYLIRAVDSIVNDSEISEGVAVFVTKSANMPLFDNDSYKVLDTIEVGSVTGTLMFRDRNESS